MYIYDGYAIIFVVHKKTSSIVNTIMSTSLLMDGVVDNTCIY
jgi:hypothetical protein